MTEKHSTTLWTKDFTIITLGTVVSMLGNAVSGFAISLLVLDYTGSTFLYALYMVAYNLPKIVMPLIAGPYLDSFSRKKTIYTLDFISAGLYAGIYILLSRGLFSYGPFLLLCVLIGSIDSIYEVAYDSFYPLLVSEGNFTKAYSISSLIYPLAAIMVPVASYVYDTVGLSPLFAFNAVSFLIAAIFETQIKAQETHTGSSPKRASLSYLKSELKGGLDYIRGEKGLLVITAYFFFTMMLGSASGTLWLPHFKGLGGSGVQLYTFVMGANVLGRLVGGMFHYRFHYKTETKFAVALIVYVSITFLEGSFVFTPPVCMLIMCFISGCLAVNSFNIRIAATQSYVPDSFRARFNGTFLMLTTLGSMLGNLSAGILGEFLPTQYIIAGTQVLNLVAIFAIIWPGREYVKQIYNREV
jgi:DHA3 family macrolide efflux protein-like MFS transporter